MLSCHIINPHNNNNIYLLMKNSNTIHVAPESCNIRSEIEVIDLTNDDDDDSILIETSVSNTVKCKLTDDIKIIAHKGNKVRRSLLQQYDMVKHSHHNNVHSSDQPVVRCGLQNTLPQEMPEKSIKCELNNRHSLFEDKSASTRYVASHIYNLKNKDTFGSREEKIFTYQNSGVNSAKKSDRICNRPDKEHQTLLNISNPGSYIKSNPKYSAHSRNEHMKHSLQLNCKSTPNIEYSSPKSSRVRKKKLFSLPQEKVGRNCLFNYFKPLNSSAEKTSLVGHSTSTNISEVPLVTKENGHTNVELEQKKNELKFHKQEEIFQNHYKNCLTSSTCEEKVIMENKEEPFINSDISNTLIKNQCNKSKNKSNSSLSSYISTTSNSYDVLPKVHKRHISPKAEKALPRKKKKTHLNREMKEHLSNGNHKVKKQVANDFQQCEQTFHKNSTESASQTSKLSDAEKKLLGNTVPVGSGFKETTDCNIKENENERLTLVEKMLKIDGPGNKKSPADLQLYHKPSKCEVNVLSSQSKIPPDKYPHKSNISSSLPQGSVNENSLFLSSRTKSHNHSSSKKHNIKIINIHENKCDASYSDLPCSANTKCNSEKRSTDLNLEKISQAPHCELEFEKSISTEVSADFSSLKELKKLTIAEPLFSSTSTFTHIESCENWNQTLQRESFGKLDQSHNCSQIIANTSEETRSSRTKITIGTLVTTMKQIFCEQFCQPWLLFDTSGIPNCCCTKPIDDLEQFNILSNINNMIQLGNPMLAVELFTKFTFSEGIPDAVSVQRIFQLMLETDCMDVLYAVQSSIISLLAFYPPCLVHSASYYRDVFASQCSMNSPIPEGLVHYLLNQLSQVSENSKDENFLLPCVNKPLFVRTSNSSEQTGESCKENFRNEKCVCRILLILSNIRDSFSSDFSNWIFKYALDTKHNITKMATQPLIATAIWPRSAYNCVGAVKGVICSLVKCCLKLWCFKNLSVSDKSVLIELLHMAAEVVRYTVPIMEKDYPFFGPACDALANRVYNQMNLYELDEKTKEHFLHSLKPDWLAMKVGSLLIAEIINAAPSLTLSTMMVQLLSIKLGRILSMCHPDVDFDITVEWHFLATSYDKGPCDGVAGFIKRLAAHTRPINYYFFHKVSFVEEHYFLHKSGGFIEHSPNKLVNDTVNTTKPVNVNKRDAKGEVMLHVACRKGNLEKVKSLLNDPHIRVNAQDYAGWTPLQESIVTNRIECIKALLNYDSPGGERVDTSLPNIIEGRTPLMTAALYNNLLVCKMLLKHSGPSLLKQEDKNGKTVFDYSESEELKNFLIDAEHKYKHVKKRTTINLGKEGWKKLEPLLPLTIFKYLITFKIMEITETLKREKYSNLNTINVQETSNSGSFNMNVNVCEYKKDYTPYRILKKLVDNDDTKGDVILDKLRESFLWYLIHVIDN